MQVKVKQLVEYNGHGLRANGSVDLNLKVKYSRSEERRVGKECH